MINQIIFDFDGTLVNSLDIFIKIGNQMAEKYNMQPVSREKIKELMMLPMKKRIQILKLPKIKLPKIGFEVLHKFNEYAAKAEPFEGIKEMLENLHKEGYGLNIVSSNTLDNINAFLKENQLSMFKNMQSSRGLFDKHVTIGKLISRLDVKKEEVIYVGDEYRDVEACKKIGIRVISVLWGFDPKELLEKAEPDFIVSAPGEISEIIMNINNYGMGK
ncbi:phosphoglycolate phosphatase [Ruminiclostridium sufflavum DSM 19573]|uniref:Phosphoglycolate phosphatase n=1 Tax=Ruminiclostridium sufflavum DSM 19573 TaxID=1121337 RepID=A0A318XJF6_9FIRM|nr:HAD-IA family hydrolase [Ruminiclostridium sufflavum]PYG86666.1 phosphoglycolate phosphatase [Ruminiclostridium sufflavum DSM 19573]